MTSEVEERPRLVTGGYGRHRSQWVKLSENIYFIGGFMKRVTVKQRATTRVCHLEYTDTLSEYFFAIEKPKKLINQQ